MIEKLARWFTKLVLGILMGFIFSVVLYFLCPSLDWEMRRIIFFILSVIYFNDFGVSFVKSDLEELKKKLKENGIDL